MSKIESFLSRLQNKKKSGAGWSARCPAHDDQHNSLSVKEGNNGYLLLKCFAGCSFESVVQAVGFEAKDCFPDNGNHDQQTRIKVADLAGDKELPESFLRELGLKDAGDMVEIAYLLADGKPAHRKRYRTKLKAKDGSRWNKGEGAIVPYGLWRKREGRDLHIVEGESDCWTLWYYGFNAIGIPGADMVNSTLKDDHLAGADTIYIHKEPDKGGETFVKGMADKLKDLGWRGKALVIKLPVKDANELHKHCKRIGADFREEMRKAVEAATALNEASNDETETQRDPLTRVLKALEAHGCKPAKLPPDAAYDYTALCPTERYEGHSVAIRNLPDCVHFVCNGDCHPKEIARVLGLGIDDLSRHTESETAIRQWPAKLSEAAYHGLAGEVVRAIAPHTEADPAALLIQLVTAFGNAIGRAPFFVVEAARHYTNLFVCIVGNTSKARKGTSWSHILRLFQSVKAASIQPDGWHARIMEGLSSGEGLIWQVRDPIEKCMPVMEKKRIVGYETVIVDEGVSDKRLLVIESEFASVLRLFQREGNTLSAIIRRAWDTGDLRAMTKNSPATATGAHISIIGHITRNELLRYLQETEAGNGFANRFIWICAKRSKSLPEGGRIETVNFAPILKRLHEAIDFAGKCGEMKRDEKARALWYEAYPKLSEGKPGLLGAVASRAEAQVLRLSCIYALLDCSIIIRQEHLEAALEIWRYCEESARYIFGEALGDPIADAILRALRNAEASGLTRTDISNLFGRNVNAGRINAALTMLLENDLARCDKEKTTDSKRPPERWHFINSTPTTTNTRHEINEFNEGVPSAIVTPSLNSLISYPSEPIQIEDEWEEGLV